jgi:hypothetical protein
LAQRAVGDADLLVEVAAVDHPGELDRPAQVELAPATAHLRAAQRVRQAPGLLLELGDVLAELALPARALPVEVDHLVAEPVEPLHHLGLVDHPSRHLRPRAGPQQPERTPEEQAEHQRDEDHHRVHAPTLHAPTDNPREIGGRRR